MVDVVANGKKRRKIKKLFIFVILDCFGIFWQKTATDRIFIMRHMHDKISFRNLFIFEQTTEIMNKKAKSITWKRFKKVKTLMEEQSFVIVIADICLILNT